MNFESLNNTQRETWGRVWTKLYARLLAAAHRLTKDTTQSQDLVQDAFMRCLTYAPNPEKIKEPLNYLSRTMRNAWYDSRDNRSVVLSLDELATSESIESKELSQYLRVEPQVQQSLEREELLESRRAYLMTVPLTLYESELLNLLLRGEKSEEIAEKLDKDVRIIRADVNALKAKLRYRLKNRTRQVQDKPPLARESGL